MSPFNGFAVRNNIIKQKSKAIHLAVLFAFVIAISVGITLVVNEISDSIDRMEKGEFFGDAVVSTVTGQGLGTDVLANVRSADGVAKAYPVYQKNVNIGDDSVQVKGMGLDETNEARLTDYWMIDASSLEKLKSPDTILLSQMVLRDLKLNIGDSITLGSGKDAVTLRIVGSYNTMNNDGKSAILSEESFLKTLRDYSIRTVNVFMKGGTDFNDLKTSIEGRVNDSYIQVDSSSDVQKTSAKQSDQFIKLIDCMIIVLVAASVLMLVNSISMNIKNNQYSLSVTKLLGATNRNLMAQSLFEGIIYGVFGVAVGIASGIMLNYVLTSSMNKMTAFNLKATLPAPLLILCGFGFLLVAILAEVISTAMNYKTDYKAVLVQE